MKPFESSYDTLSVLGRGGMGCVYLARHKRLGTLWAIKEVDKRLGHSVDLLAEANILKKLNHPALPRIVDILEDSGSIYIIEDYIEGVSLDKRIGGTDVFPEKIIRKWMTQLCDALAYLHGQSPPIIYRDLKPSNVMLTPAGDVKLIDFGIAREYKRESNADTYAIGTRGYAAPEQYGASQTDGRTDIYSLGVTLYHVVTGKSPNEPPYELRPVRQWRPGYSEGMEYIIGKCTRVNPAERYRNIGELMRDLKNIDSFSAASRKRRIADAIALAAWGFLIVFGVALALLGVRRAREEEQSAYEAQYRQGIVLIDAGNLEQARQVLFAADDFAGTGEGHLAMAAALFNAQDYDDCVSLAEDSAKLYPTLTDNAQLRFCWGAALYNQGDIEGAVPHLMRACEAVPDNALYMRYLAMAHAKLGDVAAAELLFERMKGMADDGTNAFVHAGILSAQGKRAQAAEEYERCIATSKDDELTVRAYRELAGVYKQWRADEPDKVSDEIDALLAMRAAFPNQEEAFIYDSLGDAYYAQGALNEDAGAFENAIESFQTLIRLGYGRASSYLNVAIIQQRVRRYGEAEKTLLEMVDLYPQNTDALIQIGFLIAEREGAKAQSERDYSEIVQYYQKAVERGASGESLQRLEGIIRDLKAGGWIQ